MVRIQYAILRPGKVTVIEALPPPLPKTASRVPFFVLYNTVQLYNMRCACNVLAACDAIVLRYTPVRQLRSLAP